MKNKFKYAIVQISSPNCRQFLQTFWLSFSKFNYQMASGLYLGYKTLKFLPAAGTGDAIEYWSCKPVDF